MYDTLDTIRVQRTYIDSLQPTYHIETLHNATHSSLVEERPLSFISVPTKAPPPVFSNPIPQSIPIPNSVSMPHPIPQSTSIPNSGSIPNSVSIPQSIPIEQTQINEQITNLNNAILQLRQDHLNQQKEIEYLKQLLAAKEHYNEPEYENEEPEPKKDDIPVINEPSPHDNITIHDYTDETIKEISGTTLILFYTPSCPHCVTLKPLYTFMAPIFIKRNITVGMLNGVENRNSLREFKIQGVPTIILVHNNERHVYQGSRVLKDIVHWVQHIVTNVDLNLIRDASITINE